MFTRLTDLPWWPAIGWTMIHFLWIGTLIGLIALAGRLLLRQSRPQIRYLFLSGCLLLMATSPWLILWHLLPDSPSPAHGRGPAAGLLKPGASERITGTGESMLPSAGTRPARQSEAVSHWSWEICLDQAAVLAPWLWLIGTPLTLLFVCSGFAGTRQLRRGSRIVTEEWLVALSTKLHRSLNLSWQVVTATSDEVASPILIGVIKPMILLPPALINKRGVVG